MIGSLQCVRCGRKFTVGLLLNHRTKFRIKVVELCTTCCRDLAIGLLHNHRRLTFGYLESFQSHWQKPLRKAA